MRTVVCSAGAAILFIALATRASAQGCPDVTGCWAGDYTGGSSGTLEITLQQTGSQLSGHETVNDVNFGTQSGDVSGTITCAAFTFAFPFAETSGLVTGNCMAGTWSSEFAGSGTWQGCRVACMCGNGFIQPGEECDPPGSSCAGGFECRTDCTCETPALRHFQCYEVRPPQRFDDGGVVHLMDRSGAFDATVRNILSLCAPASKNGGDPDAVSDPGHLANYGIKPLTKGANILNRLVTNQFGQIHVDGVKPARLLVPSAKGLSGPPASPAPGFLNHFSCYKVKRARGSAKFVPQTVTIQTQFETVSISLTKPLRLCAPVDKNGEGVTSSPTGTPDHLLCYRMRGTVGFPTMGVFVTNQFGPQTYQLSQRREFCVPSTSVPATGCPELLVNGGFDLPVASNTTDSNGWSSANIDTVGGWKPTDGNPGPHFTINQAGQLFTDPTLMQNVAGLVVGETYRLTGAYRSYAPVNGDPAKPDAFAVVVQPQPLDHPSTVVLALPRPDPETAWTAFAVEFVPSSSDATVSFVAERMGDDSSFDVDNLSLVGPLTELCR